MSMTRRQFVTSLTTASTAAALHPITCGLAQPIGDAQPKLSPSPPPSPTPTGCSSNAPPWGDAASATCSTPAKPAAGRASTGASSTAAARSTHSQLAASRGKWDVDNFCLGPATKTETRFAKVHAGIPPSQRQDILTASTRSTTPLRLPRRRRRYGHQIGLKIHAWVTINEDDHGWGWPSEFTKHHPEFRWVRRDGTPYHSQLSFAFPEVRDYKLAILEELLEATTSTACSSTGSAPATSATTRRPTRRRRRQRLRNAERRGVQDAVRRRPARRPQRRRPLGPPPRRAADRVHALRPRARE